MERDSLPSQPERKRRKRRQPAYVPLPIAAETQARAQEHAERAKEALETKEGKRKKRKKRAQAAPEAAAPKTTAEEAKKPDAKAEKAADTTPESEEAVRTDTSSETSKKPVEATESSPTAHEKTLDPAHTHDTEASPEPAATAKPEELSVIPLDAAEAEEEVFVSDRLRRKHEPAEAAAEAFVEDPVADLAAAEAEPAQQEPISPNTAAASTPRRTPAHGATPQGGPRQSPNLPPVPPYNPNIHTGGGNILPPNPEVAAASAAPNTLPNPTPNTLNQFQERRHNGRAILAGILVGGLIEHIRHKRREKRMEKAHKKEVKELNKEHQATNLRLREVEAKQGEAVRQKTALERQLERLKKAPAEALPHRTAAIKERAPETPAKAVKLETVPAAAAERPKAEKELTEAEKAIKKAQEAVERAHSELEQPELPPDRKVEASAWHRIEVDKKTGKAVENPTLAYGEEFKHEQHQEQLRKLADEASMDSDKFREQYSPFQTLPTPGANASQQHPKKPQPHGSRSSRDQVVQAARDMIQNANAVDAGLWVALFIVLLLIIMAL